MQKLLITVALLFVQVTHAHDFWIQPSSFQPNPGERVDLTLNVGADFSGDAIPRIEDWYSRFETHDAFGVETVEGELGDDPAGHLNADQHSALVIYRSERDFVDLHPGKFDSYLKEEGLEWVIDYRKKHGLSDTRGREWFSRCAKTLIRPRGTQTGTEIRKSTGMPLEILALEDPYSLDKSGYLPIKLLYREQPLGGAQVIAYSLSNPEEKILEFTDDNGIASFYLTHTDQWLIKTVHMIHAPENDKDVHWESFWASLTFETEIQ